MWSHQIHLLFGFPSHVSMLFPLTDLLPSNFLIYQMLYICHKTFFISSHLSLSIRCILYFLHPFQPPTPSSSPFKVLFGVAFFSRPTIAQATSFTRNRKGREKGGLNGGLEKIMKFVHIQAKAERSPFSYFPLSFSSSSSSSTLHCTPTTSVLLRKRETSGLLPLCEVATPGDFLVPICVSQ